MVASGGSRRRWCARKSRIGTSSPSGGPNCRRRAPCLIAIASADLVALIAAPPTLTRPWMRVPSMVKKRRFMFSIGLRYSPSGVTSP